MVKKLFGYILSLVGLGIFLLSLFPEYNTFYKIPEDIPSLYVTILGLIIIFIGIVFLKFSSKGKSKSKQQREVPIYHGKEVVGYRRH